MARQSKKRSKRNADFWSATSFLWPYRRWMIISIIAAFGMGLGTVGSLTAALPLLNVLIEGRTINEWVTESLTQLPAWAEFARGPLRWIGDAMPADPVWAVAVIMAVLAVIQIIASVLQYVQEYTSDRAAIAAVNDVRLRLYDHILRVPMGYFGMSGTSDVTSRLVGDAMGLQDGYKLVLGRALQEPFKGIFALGFAVAISWQLAAFLLLFLPPMAIVVRKFGKKLRHANKSALSKNADLLGQIDASLAGIRVVKTHNAERFERRKFKHVLRRLLGDQYRMARYEALSTPVMQFLGLCAVSLFVLVAAHLLFNRQTLSGGAFIAFMMALVQVSESARRLSKLNNTLQKANAAAGRIYEVLHLPTEERKHEKTLDGKPVLPPINRSASIAFENVTFTYPSGGAPAVADVNISIEHGQTLAVVGRNGSGKTTLLAMLPRLYEPTGGRVLIDGIDSRFIPLPRLRRMIAVVTQDAVIFPGTIADNIAYGLPHATRAAIEAAAQQAYAHDFIMAKPQGYDTPTVGLGGQLSGGQKQRIAIARAILKNAPILILDEATSQVDAESEALIGKAMEQLTAGRTTLVIAHRLSTIAGADRIAVMEAGQLVAEGTHAELLEASEVYKSLYERQLFAA